MADKPRKADLIGKIVNEFKDYESKLNGDKDTKMFKLRKEAVDAFEQNGIPTRKHEEWKYTNLNFVRKTEFELPDKSDADNFEEKKISDYLYEGLETNLLVFVNGYFSEKHSKIQPEEKGISIRNLASAIEDGDKLVEEYLGQNKDYHMNPFAAMNTAMAADGAFVNISNGALIEKPIQLLFITDTRKQSVLSQPRNLFIVGENAQMRLIWSHHTIGENPSLNNKVTEMILRQGANVEAYIYQEDFENSHNIGDTKLIQEKDSTFSSVTISLSGAFHRNNMSAVLNGEGAHAGFYGFFYGEDNNLTDNHILVDHAVPNCTSDELYKNILNDTSHGIFNGKILVRQDAQKTDAFQTNRNILLTDSATVNTKPQLEIYADDVKCSHGATSGTLDKTSLFYLRSRGLDKEQAKALLLNAFAQEIVNKIKIEPLRNYIAKQVENKLINKE